MITNGKSISDVLTSTLHTAGLYCKYFPCQTL